MTARTVFVTGATGYIGGRLVPRLLDAGFRVRCLSRSARKLRARPWSAHPRVEIVEGGVEDRDALERGMEDCEAAYYLVHSMEVAGREYRERDRALARTFAEVAAGVKLGRIIYLGGLGETGENLSEHLTSRREVESALASTHVPLTVFRTAMIIGSGSASFEILRYLVDRLPVMVTPRWVNTECQPVSVRNVLNALTAALDEPRTIGRTLDLGGPDVLSYRELMQIMANACGLSRRVIMPVPVLTPRLSSLWIHLVTPLSHRIARPLAEGLRNRVVCRNDEAHRLLPQRWLSVREAIDAALGKVGDAAIETAWSDAGPMPGDPDWSGGKVYADAREVDVDAPADRAFAAIERIGGHHGYYAADFLWHVRGWMDRLVGGPGLRRGRRHPTRLAFGESLDFWRVTAYRAGRRLELRAEMKLPGIATLTFETRPLGDGRTRVRQTARFKPRGVAGMAYWYSVLPLHHFVFDGMLRGIRQNAECARGATSPEGPEATAPQPAQTARNSLRTAGDVTR